jgi:hypothetical protein
MLQEMVPITAANCLSLNQGGLKIQAPVLLLTRHASVDRLTGLADVLS